MTQVSIEYKQPERDFQPSMKTLSRIMQALVSNGTGGKTQLSLDANLNYARLAKHVAWLEKKGLVESKIESTKINIVLTRQGKVFASVISKDRR